ncbi:MAG: BglG family transcription antiterminator [Bacillota bacterium]
MKLSSRQHEIIRIIFQSDDYITIDAIADMLSLSTRTIKREIEQLGMFFETIGVPLERKSGKGIKILKDEGVVAIVNSILDKNTIPVFSSKKRVIILLLTLLFADDAIKRFSLAKQLGTSELTVSSDLTKCEEILSQKGITLVRKQGYGIYLAGSEERRRHSIFEIINESTKGFSLLEVPSKTISQFVNIKQLEEIAKILELQNQTDKFYNSDRTRDSLALHLYIQKNRVAGGNKIPLATENLSQRGVEISTEIIEKLSAKYGVNYSIGEIHYFADVMALSQGVVGVLAQSETALYIARKLARKLEGGFGILVDAENDFFSALIAHLVATVGRSEKNIDVLNPILEEIKNTYPEIYKMVEGCALELKEEIGISFGSDEVGYITLHMCVIALDGKSQRVEKCGALIVCPSGLVTSQLLAINVKKAFPNLEILETSALGGVGEIISSSKEIDIVISTHEVNTYGLPLAVVSPFITPKDKDLVETALRSVSRREILREVKKIETDMATSVCEKMQVKDIIAEIVMDMIFEDEKEFANIGELIEFIASSCKENEKSYSQITLDLSAREEIGSTVMPDGETMLIHAKTAGVAKVCFGVCRFENKILLENPQSEVSCAVIMLAPQTSKLGTKVLSEISQALILQEDFYEKIKCGKRAEINEKVKEILYNYYFDNYKE